MGMHTGLIAATAGRDELLAELKRHTGEFELSETPLNPTTYNGDWPLAIGERDGRAFLTDSTMLLSTEDDMIVTMSETLGTVVCAGAETVSGTFWLTAARDGDLLRSVFVQHSGMSRGMAIGDPLPSEREIPIEDEDGDGIFAALSHLGLHIMPWLNDGPAAGLRYSAGRPPAGGRIADIKKQHYERYKLPDDEPFQVRAVIRDE